MASNGRNGAGYAKLGGEVGSPKASRKFPGTIRGWLKAWPVRAIGPLTVLKQHNATRRRGVASAQIEPSKNGSVGSWPPRRTANPDRHLRRMAKSLAGKAVCADGANGS